MTVGRLKEMLSEFDDNDIVFSETRGDNLTSPSVFNNGFFDTRNRSSYYDSIEEALEDGVPRENIRRQIIVTGHT